MMEKQSGHQSPDRNVDPDPLYEAMHLLSKADYEVTTELFSALVGSESPRMRMVAAFLADTVLDGPNGDEFSARVDALRQDVDDEVRSLAEGAHGLHTL